MEQQENPGKKAEAKKNYKKKYKKNYFETVQKHLQRADYLNQLPEFMTNSLASSSVDPKKQQKTQQKRQLKAEKLEQKQQKISQNITPNESEPLGYVTIVTNFGKLNFELYCKQYPVVCSRFLNCCRNFAENFVKCEITNNDLRILHTESPDQMEFREGILKKERGILYAEIIPKSEKPQEDDSEEEESRFCIPFSASSSNSITFSSSDSIQSFTNRRFVIFGRVVGGLKSLEKMQTSKTEAFKITDTTIFVDPFEV